MAFYVFRLDTGEIIAAANTTAELRGYINNANGITYEPGPVRDWDYLTIANGAITIDTEEWAAGRRATRDLFLVESDYTQLMDITDDHLPGTKAEWATYRQELRDIPQQEGFPETVVWPTQPTEPEEIPEG